MDWNLFLGIVIALGTFIGVIVTSVLWLSRQFSTVRALVYDKTEQLKEFIIDKIEYHEKHDDRRFHELGNNIHELGHTLGNDIWAIKLRNASIDGQVVGSTIKEKLSEK